MEDYYQFESFKMENKNVSCDDYITPNNVHRSVKINGLPWTANKLSIVQFFEGFDLKRHDICIDVK